MECYLNGMHPIDRLAVWLTTHHRRKISGVALFALPFAFLSYGYLFATAAKVWPWPLTVGALLSHAILAIALGFLHDAREGTLKPSKPGQSAQPERQSFFGRR